MEHSEANNSSVPDVCRLVVTSGQAYGAKQWLSTLARQHERLTYIMIRNDRKLQSKHITFFFFAVLNSINPLFEVLFNC